jgi:hypothetical protein
MKDLMDLEVVIEEEVDTKADELVKEDHFVITIMMRKGTWQEIPHFHEDPGVHIEGTPLMLLKTIYI